MEANGSTEKYVIFPLLVLLAIISKIKADYPDLTGEGFREILKILCSRYWW